MSSIKHLLAKKMRDVLTEACMTNIAEDDPTRVDIVAIRNAGGKAGKARFVLTVKHFDPLNAEAWGDSTVGNRAFTNTLGMQLPAGEVGGTTFEMVRGIVELKRQHDRLQRRHRNRRRIRAGSAGAGEVCAAQCAAAVRTTGRHVWRALFRFCSSEWHRI